MMADGFSLEIVVWNIYRQTNGIVIMRKSVYRGEDYFYRLNS